MYRKILVPLDGSSLAERALPYAEAIARRSGAQLRLVRGVEVHVPHGQDAALVQRRLADEAETYLSTVAGRLNAAQAVESGVFYGHPQEGILDQIRLYGADLVMMSTHGRSGLTRLLMGSVADHVLRHAPVPVLLVPPACDRSWDAWDSGVSESTAHRGSRGAAPGNTGVPLGSRPLRVLVPLDGSAHAAEALPVVRELAHVAPLHVTLVSAVDFTTGSMLAAGTFELEAQVLDVESAATRRRVALTQEAERLEDVSRYADVRVMIGSPADVIVECAAAKHTDLVVMATHGRGGLSRVVLGSVATGVLHALHCPLLLVRPVGAHTPEAEQVTEPDTEPAAPTAAVAV